MTIHFKDGDALRGFTHVYFKDGANLRQATQVYFKDGDNLRKVYDVSAPGAVPFTINTIGLRVTVSWTPAPDNGFPITMYGLRYRDTDDAAWTEMSLASTVREWTTPTLTLNEEYEFQMRAQNELGWNTWSTSKTATITQNVPSKPGAPILRRRGSGGINAAWTAPNANGAAITAYQLQYKLSSAAGWTTASSTITGTNYTVTGLTIGSTYDFRVRARNVGGWSQYSDSSSLATASTPGAPTWGAFTTATRSLTLRWTAPSSNGGAAITGYEIEYRSGTSGSWTDGPDPGANATSRTISSLTPNTTYQFRIRAINSVGSGTWSANKTGRTRQLTAPDPVRITTSQTWTIPASWNEVRNILFRLQGGAGGLGAAGGATSITVNNTAYQAAGGAAGVAAGNRQTISLAGNRFLTFSGTSGSGKRWNVAGASILLNSALSSNTTRYLVNIGFFRNGNIFCYFNTQDTGVRAPDAPRLSGNWERSGGITFTVGSNTLTVSYAGATRVTSSYYFWTPSNSADVTAFHNAIGSSNVPVSIDFFDGSAAIAAGAGQVISQSFNNLSTGTQVPVIIGRGGAGAANGNVLITPSL